MSLYTFTVTDAATGAPIAGAQCAIVDRYEMIKPFEGIGCTTGADGICSVEPLFPPNYYSVYKAGYDTVRGPVPGTQINVALGSTSVEYWVTILAGSGGDVEPSGNFKVAANTKLSIKATPDSGYILDYWLVNGVQHGPINPLGVTIDRDSFSVNAIFKEGTTPPPNGDPVMKQIHVFDTVVLDGGMGLGASKYTSLTNVDTKILLGGKLDYTVSYMSAKLAGVTCFIEWNGEVLEKIPFTAFDVGKTVSGSLDLTGKIRNTNSVGVRFSQGPLGFNRVSFDVWVALGFSEEPVIDPVVPTDWDWWWTWAIAGGVIAVTTVVGVIAYQELERRKAREELLTLLAMR
ncbi:hypothetical protein ES702_03854 [subsurface metagenome]